MEKRMKLSFSLPSKARTSTNPVAAAGFRATDNVAPAAYSTPGPASPQTPPPAGAGSTNPVRDTSKAPDKTSSSHTSYGLITRNTAPDVKPAVIPPLPNSGRLLNTQSGEPTDASTGAVNTSPILDTSKPSDNPSSSHTSYGLIVRNKAAAESADAAGELVTCPVAADGPSAASGDLMLRRYKEDMAVLPDQPDEEEYEEVPVEGFGAALLAGYGWKEGDAIGRNCTKKGQRLSSMTACWEGLNTTTRSNHLCRTRPDVNPAVIPPLPNSGRLFNARSGEPTDASTGAGNTSPVLDTSMPPDNPSSSHTSYGLIVRNKAAAESADAAGEPVTCPVAADGPSAASGDLMLRRYKDDMAVLPDQPDAEEYEEVPVEGFGAALLAGYGWKEGGAIGRNCTKKEAKVVQYDRRTGSQGLGFEPSKKRDMERRDQMQKVPNAPDSRQSRSVNGGNNFKVQCLHSHIRVRVVSKNMSKRLYMMKGRVLDVTGPTTCDIVMDDGTEVVQGVEQDMIETVLPPVNGNALVLCGEHKGVYGHLVEKNPEERVGVLEDADTRDMIPVGLDKIAEYVGDPELIGY
ncbi:hypothetical protein ACQ4PT_000054 [Festuca glaucescens]